MQPDLMIADEPPMGVAYPSARGLASAAVSIQEAGSGDPAGQIFARMMSLDPLVTSRRIQ